MTLYKIPTTSVNLQERLCHVYTAHEPPLDWEDRPFYLFISLKNRKFTKALIGWFIDVCNAQSQIGKICIVDEPYLYNRKAELGVETLAEEEIETIQRISAEITRKVQRVMRAKGSSAVSLISWEHLSAETPQWIKNEIDAAFQKKGQFYIDTLQQVSRMKGYALTQKKLGEFAHFFLCELPVLIFAYYADPIEIVDFYPGENSPILWKIETGEYRSELPEISEFVQRSGKLVYINVLPV